MSEALEKIYQKKSQLEVSGTSDPGVEISKDFFVLADSAPRFDTCL